MKQFLGWLSAKNLGVKKVASAQTAAVPALAPGEYVKAAMAHHRAGRLAEADSLYRKALAVDPDDSDALQLLGVVQHQTGDSAKAVELIEQAISIAPRNFSAYCNLGLAYRALDRVDKAESCFSKAVQLNPSSTDALNNLGNIRKEHGQFADAEDFYRKALALDPATPAAWKNLGQVLRQCQRFDDAMECYQKALDLRPTDAIALVDIGMIHLLQGELSEAEHDFRLALQFDGNLVEAMCNLGDVLMRLDRLDEAERFCRSALAARPDDPDALNILASVLLRTSEFDEAEACCVKALSLRRDHAPTQITMGYILDALERPVDADKCFHLAMQLSSSAASVRYSLSILKLLRGDYREGLELYESRFDVMQRDVGRTPQIRALLDDTRRWQGESLSGQRLLIWAEQGFGDSLMMLRYLPLLKSRGAGPVIVLCEQALKRIVYSIPGFTEGVSCAQSVSANEFDLHCPIMSLPFLFGTTLDAVPGHVPYIAIPDQLGNEWKDRLKSITRTKVGLAWAGSKTLPYDARRSIPLSAFDPLRRSDGVQLISLQKGEGAEQVDAWRGQIEDWMDDCADFMDTAALVNNLDLVISVDSAVVHLAGALGKPVWLLNRYGSEWRWGRKSVSCPWYPSMRIFRQRERENWTGVIAEVTSELATKFPPA